MWLVIRWTAFSYTEFLPGIRAQLKDKKTTELYFDLYNYNFYIKDKGYKKCPANATSNKEHLGAGINGS